MGNHIKDSMVNRRGLKIEVGKTYFYSNIGLGEIKTHTVRYFSNNVWAVDYDGRVDLDSLFETE